MRTLCQASCDDTSPAIAAEQKRLVLVCIKCTQQPRMLIYASEQDPAVCHGLG